MSFLGELKRRNVGKVGIAYLLVAWLIAQVIATLNDPLGLPDWVDTVVILLLAVGFPIALTLAWVYEVTPEGIKATSAVPESESIAHVTGRRLNVVVTGLLLLAVAFLAADNYLLDRGSARVDGTESASEPASAEPGSPQSSPILIAVLPLENLSPNPDDAFFAAGLHEEILNRLSKLGNLRVISRTSVMQYANRDRSIPEIARELNVGAVIEGSVRYANDRIRVTTQLIDARTDEHLWSETYEREFDDIFAIESDIAMQVANALAIEFSPEERRAIGSEATSSSRAYELYLSALSLVGVDGRLAIEYLDQAIALDPRFAVALGLRAQLYAQTLVNTVGSQTVDEAERDARAQLLRESAETAIALDPTTATAYAALVTLDTLTWHWTDALRTLERMPGPGLIAAGVAGYVGRHAEHIASAREAAELNPNSWIPQWNIAIALAYAGEAEAGRRAQQEAIALGGPVPVLHLWLALLDIALGNEAEALRELQTTERLMGANRSAVTLTEVAYAYGRLGRSEDARRIFDELDGPDRNGVVGLGGTAALHLAIGDRENAIAALESVIERIENHEIEQGFFNLMNIKMNVTRNPLLEEPVFVDLRNRIRGD